VRPDLALSVEHRIARIDRDRWIGYGRAREILGELERVLHWERRQRPDNPLVVGASNNGKTAIARRFLARSLPPEDPAAQYSTIPVAMIQAPNGRAFRSCSRPFVRHSVSPLGDGRRSRNSAPKPTGSYKPFACACC
jgi:hypothetical protein